MQILIYLAIAAGLVVGSYFGVEALKDAGREDERLIQTIAASQAKDAAREQRDAALARLEALARENEDAALAAKQELEGLRNERKADVAIDSVVFDGAWNAWLRGGSSADKPGN